MIPALRNKDGPGFIPAGEEFLGGPSEPPPPLPEETGGEAEPLTPALEKKAEPFMKIFGEETMRRLFSKSWALREQGLKEIEKTVLSKKGGPSGLKDSMLSGTLGVTSFVIGDKIA